MSTNFTTRAYGLPSGERNLPGAERGVKQYVADPAQSGYIMSASRPEPMRHLNVLVVEDDPDTRAGMRKVLLQAGFTVTEADDGLRALEIASQRRFDAIVCDLRLPYLPGGGFYEALLERDPDLAHRVIFVSAITHDPAVRRFLDGTGRPYLQKPYEVKELIETVRRVAA
ncbi:MAG: response regulator [Gemmatimonadetes bacterium]|nr:response regulator [Gemmatimonadota bacterium]